MTTYFNIENGTCLLRREDTPSKLTFSVMGVSGKWRDGTSLGVRYTVAMSEIGADKISARSADSLARKLGGQL